MSAVCMSGLVYTVQNISIPVPTTIYATAIVQRWVLVNAAHAIQSLCVCIAGVNTTQHNNTEIHAPKR